MQEYILNHVEKINEEYHQIHFELYKLWHDYMLFTWRWWVNVAILLAPIILWIIFRKKDVTYSLLLPGLFMTLISFMLDNLGMALGLWSYPSKIIPIVPPFLPWDFGLLPVSTMFFIQWETKVSTFMKSVLFSFIASFIAQPLADYAGLYYPKHWKHYYSFPAFIVMYLFSNYLFVLSEREKNSV